MCVYISLSSSASLYSPYSIPLGHHRVPGWAPWFYTNFPITIYFIHGSVYMSMLLSQFIAPSLSPAVSTSMFSTGFISTIFLESICVCVCVCVNMQNLFFYFWFTLLCITGSRFIHLTITDKFISFYGWVIFHWI